jgi:hypothetical protein
VNIRNKDFCKTETIQHSTIASKFEKQTITVCEIAALIWHRFSKPAYPAQLPVVMEPNVCECIFPAEMSKEAKGCIKLPQKQGYPDSQWAHCCLCSFISGRVPHKAPLNTLLTKHTLSFDNGELHRV